MKVYTTGNFNSSSMFLESCTKNIYLVRSPTSSYIKRSIAACILNVIFAIVGTFLNTLVLFAFLKSKNMRRKNSYFCILVLSTTDLIVVTTVPTMSLVRSMSEILGVPRCFYRISLSRINKMMPLLSATSLITMNIERYLAIVFPFYHHTAVTKRKIIIIFIIIGSILSTCAAINFACHSIGRLVYSVGAFIICSTTLFQYVSIFIIARKSLLRRVTNVNNEETNISLRSILFNLKIARTYFFIVLLCFICYFPIATINGIWRRLFVNEEKRNFLFHWNLFVTPLISMNATFDCLIFFWGNRELRKQGWKLVRNCFRRTSN